MCLIKKPIKVDRTRALWKTTLQQALDGQLHKVETDPATPHHESSSLLKLDATFPLFHCHLVYMALLVLLKIYIYIVNTSHCCLHTGVSFLELKVISFKECKKKFPCLLTWIKLEAPFCCIHHEKKIPKLHNFVLFVHCINILQIEPTQHIFSMKTHSKGFTSLMPALAS